MNETYTKAERNRYLLGLSGQNIIYGIITSSLAYFLQFTILIPSVWVGIILSISRIFDAVKDPFVGALLNKSKLQFKDYLIILPIPTSILTVLCFTNGVYSPSNGLAKNTAIIVFAFACYLLWEIVFTLGDIPITGYPAVITTSDSDRTKLMSLRPLGAMACSISTLLIQPTAFAVSNKLGESIADERNGFLITVAVFSVLGGTLFQMTAIGSKQRVNNTTDCKQNQLKYFFTNPLLKKICISGILGSLKSTPGIVLTPLVTYYFANKSPKLSLLYTFLFGLGSFLGMAISMILTPKLSKKYENKRVYAITNIMNIIPNILLFVLYLSHKQSMANAFELLLTFLLSLISGSLISISSTMQTLIISDAIELEEKTSGKRPAALFFSCQTFIIKIGSGLSSLVVSLGYALIHFSSQAADRLNQYIASGGIPRMSAQYTPLMTTLFFMYTIPVALSSLLAALVFYRKKAKNFN